MTKAQLTALAGPTAVGEGTVVTAFMKRYPTLNVSVSVTTRDPRLGELNDVHYYFVSAQESDVMIEREDMLEWALVHGDNRYRTPRGPVDEALAADKPVLLEIDPAGACQVRTNRSDTQFIFLVLPSREKLERRLIGRGTGGPKEQARRLAAARVEFEATSEFDHVVINDDVECAVDELARLIGLEQYLSESAAKRNTRMSGIVAQPTGITSPSIDDLPKHVDSKYALVIFAAKRACQINSYNLQPQQNMIQFMGPVVDVQPDEEPLAASLREINEGLLPLEANPET